jgi:hypothetical protein
MEEFSVKLPVECSQKVLNQILNEAENVFDYYKDFIKHTKLEKSDLEYIINELLLCYLIENERMSKIDKIQMKELADVFHVMIHHFENIIKIEKKHNLFDGYVSFVSE